MCGDIALGSHTTRLGREATVLWASTRQGLGAYTIRTWARQRNFAATEEFCRDRDFSFAIDLDSEKKKKKTPRIWGITNLAQWLFKSRSTGLWEIIEENEHLRHHCLGDIVVKAAVSSSIGCLKDIKTLELNNCAILMTLSNNIGNLTGLGSFVFLTIQNSRNCLIA